MPLLCIASPRGGVGKTTLAANLAGSLRRAGRRVVALDLDPQNALRLHFGIPLAEDAGFTCALQRWPDWRTSVMQTDSGVELLPFGAAEMRAAVELSAAIERDPEMLAVPVRAMLADPDLVVVADLPSGPSSVLAAIAPLADLVIAVLLTDSASAAQLPELESGHFLGQGTLGTVFAARIGVVMNQVEPRARLSAAVVETAARHLGPRLLGAICRDEAVDGALARQMLLEDAALDSRAAADLRWVTRGVLNHLPAIQQPMPVQFEPMHLPAFSREVVK